MKTIRNLASDKMLSTAYAGLELQLCANLLDESSGSSAEADARILEVITSDHAILARLREACGNDIDYTEEDLADYRLSLLEIIRCGRSVATE